MPLALVRGDAAWSNAQWPNEGMAGPAPMKATPPIGADSGRGRHNEMDQQAEVITGLVTSGARVPFARPRPRRQASGSSTEPADHSIPAQPGVLRPLGLRVDALGRAGLKNVW